MYRSQPAIRCETLSCSWACPRARPQLRVTCICPMSGRSVRPELPSRSFLFGSVVRVVGGPGCIAPQGPAACIVWLVEGSCAAGEPEVLGAVHSSSSMRVCALRSKVAVVARPPRRSAVSMFSLTRRVPLLCARTASEARERRGVWSCNWTEGRKYCYVVLHIYHNDQRSI